MLTPDRIAGYAIPQPLRRPVDRPRLVHADLERMKRPALMRERGEAAAALESARGILAFIIAPPEPVTLPAGATNAVPMPSGPSRVPVAVWLTERIARIDAALE